MCIRDRVSTGKTFTYTDSGLIDTITNGAGTVDIDYDEFNRVTDVDGVHGGDPDADTIEYTWQSDRSELTRIDGPNAYKQDFSYDALKRLSTITDDGSKVTTYNYNLVTSTLKNMELPNDTRTDYSYDDLNRVLKLVNQTNQSEVLNSYAYRFNSQGLRDRVTYANGNYADFAYDAIGQLTDEHYKTPQATSLLQLAYTYDKAGNRLTKKYDNDAARVEEYTVNEYNQVTAVDGDRGKYINVTGLIDEENPESLTVKRLTPEPEKEAVSVDIVNDFFIGRKVELAEGNNTLQAIATDKAGNDATYPSEGSHDVTLEEDVDEDYEYDLRGNMIVKKVDDEAVARYFYNKDNLIEYIWYPEGVHDDKHPHYIYDGLSHRVKVEYGTVTLDQDDDFSSFGDVDKTKEYVFSGTVPIIEYDNDGQSRTVARQYYWGAGLPGGIGGLLYMKVPGSPDAYYYYHYDGTGNVTCITDADKDIMALYEYDAFGNIITKCGSLANDFLFSTQLSNSNAGWYMYMFRNYDPQLGRWTQRDPIGFVGGLNLYIFCFNNPINITDFLGLKDKDKEEEGFKEYLKEKLRDKIQEGAGKTIKNMANKIPGLGTAIEVAEIFGKAYDDAWASLDSSNVVDLLPKNISKKDLDEIDENLESLINCDLMDILEGNAPAGWPRSLQLAYMSVNPGLEYNIFKGMIGNFGKDGIKSLKDQLYGNVLKSIKSIIDNMH